MSDETEATDPAPTTAVLLHVQAERQRQLTELGHTRELDRRAVTAADRLVRLAEGYARGKHREGGKRCAYFHRTELVKAAALLVAAVEVLDASQDGHDERACNG